ncbi:hypothetical protein PoB_003623200 [Plakobranchus ocellatus]|uniref:Uncharacterized protein n=1 Tax=Plakobranchus ocellatus TaxID=259542 RepID=A0AAV4AQZ3_9GAST|nr:hypothetical protein PoB_003623200 [Plakobranchus ocellatus]
MVLLKECSKRQRNCLQVQRRRPSHRTAELQNFIIAESTFTCRITHGKEVKDKITVLEITPSDQEFPARTKADERKPKTTKETPQRIRPTTSRSGDDVFMRNQADIHWTPAKVVKKAIELKSYILQQGTATYRRNRRQILKQKLPPSNICHKR